MSKIKNLRHFEIVLYLFIALVALIVPFFMHSQSGDMKWKLVCMEWLKLTPFLIIFLVNNFLLSTKLLFRSKYLAYIISCLVLLVSVTLLDNVLVKSQMKHRMEIFAKKQPIKDKAHIPFQEHGNCPPMQIEKMHPPERHLMPPMKIFFSLSVLSIGLLVIGFNSGVKIFVRWTIETEERNEKERHYLATELAYLKQQISPHFFMNTLNNIHALIDIEPEKAKDSIIKLSQLMRYLLYESENDKTLLSKEIEFLESYIELMRLRYDETKLSIEIAYKANLQPVYVPSLLFLPLIENAFKHGINHRLKSFVNMKFDIENDKLVFSIINSNFPKPQTTMSDASGIGLENIRKRLALIYDNDYILQINSDNEVFNVSLSIPVV